MEPVILTPDGYERLKEELRKLKGPKRMEVAKQLETARAHGDLRENAEYDAAKEAKTQLESRIRTLEDKLVRAKVVDLKDAPTDKVYFGTTVELKNKKTGQNITFTFAADDEADVSKNKLSISSPIGKSLLGHKKGETVEVKVPAGIIPYEILKISRL
ncbi:MAG TPA: transcription elongation factor GreA [Candidatus Omnitrophota bacterium]|nr:transcription elongation factor GreA [Candidatus Omnitrophota bacterium]